MIDNFKQGITYFTKAQLPFTQKWIYFKYVTTLDDWENLKNTYKIYFASIVLYSYNRHTDFKNQLKQIAKVTNHNTKLIIRIPRIKKNRKKPLKGNLCVKTDGDISYIQISYLKSRRILKIDTEDLPKLEKKCLNSFYFIYRPLKSCPNNIVLSKKKSRKHSLYSYLFDRHIKTYVKHIDGDDTNFCKSNLEITTSTIKKKLPLKLSPNSIKPKKLNELVGISKCYIVGHPNYYTRIWVGKRRVLIGYSNDPYHIAKLHDIGLLYYKGVSSLINYPYEYYSIFEHDLLKKTIINLQNRKNGIKPQLAQDLIDSIIGEEPESEK